MKITKKQLRQMLREMCGGDVPSLAAPVSPVVNVADAVKAVTESQSPEGELVVEMQLASRHLELAVESINNAASLCPSCVNEVAAAAPLIEATVSQAEALQETLEAVGTVVSENAEVGLTDSTVLKV